MRGIRRRDLLRTIVGVTAGAAAAAAAAPAMAAFTPPVRGRHYQKFGGLNFTPISTVSKAGDRTDWTYNDNGSIYVTGRPTLFRTRVQLPQSSVVEEVQFNYFLGSLPPMDFNIIAFDGANAYQTFPGATVDTPDPTVIQTVSLPIPPIRIDNSTWIYILTWAPQAADPGHILWGARVGYRVPDQNVQ